MVLYKQTYLAVGDSNHQNITGTIYRTSVKWDVCTEPKDHPPSHSLCTMLPTDNTYRSICWQTIKLQSSFTSLAETPELITNTPLWIVYFFWLDYYLSICLISRFIWGNSNLYFIIQLMFWNPYYGVCEIWRGPQRNKKCASGRLLMGKHPGAVDQLCHRLFLKAQSNQH